MTKFAATSGWAPGQAVKAGIVKKPSARASLARPLRSGSEACVAVTFTAPVVVTRPSLPIKTFVGAMLPPVRLKANVGAACRLPEPPARTASGTANATVTAANSAETRTTLTRTR